MTITSLKADLIFLVETSCLSWVKILMCSCAQLTAPGQWGGRTTASLSLMTKASSSFFHFGVKDPRKSWVSEVALVTHWQIQQLYLGL